MASVADTIFVKLGLDFQGFQQSLNKAVAGIQENAQSLAKGADKVSVGAVAQIASVAKMVAGPLAGAMSIGSMIKSYFSGVAQVAQMTGAYSTKLEEWRKKRALLARTTREDIILYKKSREAVTNFQISMANLSAKIVRQANPAFKWMYERLNAVSKWVDRHSNDIIRFLKVLAGVITVALIPALIKLFPQLVKMAAALLANPLTWIVVALGLLALAIDDLIVWLKGGNSALGDFWSMLGSREDVLKFITKAIDIFKNTLKTLLPYIGRAIFILGSAFVAFKVIITVIGGVVKAVQMLRMALMALAANPIIAILMAIVAALMWVQNALERAGGDWSKVLGIMGQDVIDFLNIFGGLGDKVVEFGADAVKWFTDVGNAIKTWFEDKIESVSTAWTNFCQTLEDWYNRIIGWFTDIGQAIKNAFNFDGIKEKTGKALSKLNPANWKLFGGGEESSADAAVAGERAERATQTINQSSRSSNTSIDNHITVNTNNERVGEAIVDRANNLSGTGVYRSGMQSNQSMS